VHGFTASHAVLCSGTSRNASTQSSAGAAIGAATANTVEVQAHGERALAALADGLGRYAIR
jgi:hypothetical protein